MNQSNLTVIDFHEGAFIAKETRDLLIAIGKKFDEKTSRNWPDVSQKKMCFRNCAEASFRYPELTYVEGYAFSSVGLFPMSHAWLVDQNGHYFDPTWESGFGYLGIEFTQRELLFCLEKSRQYGILDCLWWNKEVRDLLSSKKEESREISC